MDSVERDGPMPKSGASREATGWVDDLLSRWSPLLPAPVEGTVALREEALLTLEGCKRVFDRALIDALCKEYRREMRVPPAVSPDGLNWVGRGQIYVGSSYWGPSRRWKTAAGDVLFRWSESVGQRLQGANPEERAVLDTVTQVDGALVIALRTARKGSQLRQGEANRATAERVLAAGEATAFVADLSVLAPTKTQPQRTILEAELSRFTTRRVTQYLLRPGLAEELWGPIRQVNERFVSAGKSVVDVGQRWQLVQRLESIAHQLISSLTVAEESLLEKWRAVPVVDERSLLVSLDRLPEALRGEIETCVAQQERWTELYGQEATGEGRVVDTSLLPRALATRVASSFTGELSGVLIEGDAARGMRYLETLPGIRLRCAYADPPYNTGGDGFPYVDGMPHGSWLCFMEQNLRALASVCPEGQVMLSIGDREAPRLQLLLQHLFGEDKRFGPVIVQVNKGGRDYLPIATTHEFILGSGIGAPAQLRELPKPGLVFRFEDARGGWNERELRNRNPRFHKLNRPNLYYPFFVNPCPVDSGSHCEVSLSPQPGWVEVWPLNRKGESSVWRWGRPKVESALTAGEPSASELVARRTRSGRFNIYEKVRKTTTKAKSIWDDSTVRTEQGSIELRQLFGEALFPHPKPRALVERCLALGSAPGEWVLDFFAGSGTTADAALSLARRGDGLRPVVLIEQGEHFERILKPRILKAAYSGSWVDGVPACEEGVSVCYRVVKLQDWRKE
jgi:adenine-specific DNA-methyltransferase